MTAAHISQLVKGKQPHPRIHYAEALASFFGVPVHYFFDDDFFDDDITTRIEDQIANVSAWRDERRPGCVRLALPRMTRAGRGTAAVEWPGLRVRCQQRVDDLLQHTGVPHPWDINEFLDRLERHRGRGIDLCAISWTAGDSCGAWQQRGDHDVIAYAGNTSGFHQDHIILHEIGHMISQHRGRCVLSEDEAARIAPDLAPAAFAHLLDRSTGDAEEHEAETIASLIHQRVRVRPQLASDAVPPAAAQRLTRVEYIFGG